MSNVDESGSVDDQLTELAAAFNQDTDPLAQYVATFDDSSIDPFEIFIQDTLIPKDLADVTIRGYRYAFDQWCGHMDRLGRHPACPNVEHVKSYIHYKLEERKHQPDTVKNHLRRLNAAYSYWQDEPAFPHPQDFNPFSAAKQKVDLESGEKKEPPRISINQLRSILADINHIRDRGLIMLQLKLGLRVGELCNIQLQEVNLANSELSEHYTDLGTHRMIADRKNTVYIPSTDERNGNKSRRPRVLPLDDEVRRTLIQYLLIRPDCGEPWMFISQTKHNQLDTEAVGKKWKEYFHPEYAETEHHDAVTSHYGRHRFTTYWMVEREAPRELVKYMRGDVSGAKPMEGRGGIDRYIHTYYEDIEPLYRQNIFKLLA